MGQIKHSDAQAERPSSQKASAAKIQVGSDFFFLALICSEFMLNSFEYGISYLFSSSSLLPSLQLCLCLSVFVQSVPCLWFPTFEGFWFAVFVRGEALCFVGALRFPLAAVKVSQRFSLCESGRGN